MIGSLVVHLVSLFARVKLRMPASCLGPRPNMDEPDRIQALGHLTNHGLAVLVVSNASYFDRFSLKVESGNPCSSHVANGERL